MTAHVHDESSPVLFIEDVCRELGLSRRTFQRMRRAGAFPVRPVRLGGRPRWSRVAVEKFRDAEAARSQR